VDKAQNLGEFIAGLLVAGAGGAVLLWGTVTANRTDIDALRRGQDVLTTQLRSVSDDTAYMRGQLNALTTHVLESEEDDE
jgi:hypothetical protein